MQRGSLKPIKDAHGVKQWRAQWRECGKGRTRMLGRVADVSRGEARAELDRIIASVLGRAAAYSAHPEAPFGKYVTEEYLTVKTRVWKASTASTTEQLIGAYLLRDLGTRPLGAITRKELQAHLDCKADAGLSSSIVGHIRWQLVAIFRMAKGDGLITIDPTQGLVMPRCKKAPDKRVITMDDLKRAQMVLEPRERLIFRLAVCEPMRPGEIVALQLGDIQDGVVHVARRVYGGKIDTPKSLRSTRQIPLTKGTRALLAIYLDMTDETRPGAWLFPSETGVTPVAYSNVFQDRIRPVLEKIGLGHVNFQILRRTWVTEFSKREKDVGVRARLAGHTADVNENVYRQSDIDELQESMSKWSDLLQ